MIKNLYKRIINRCRGTVYIIVIFVIIALIPLAAMVIDLSMAASSNEQQLHNCEYVALAALNAYTNATIPFNVQDAGAIYDIRLQTALSRANEIAALNRMVSPQFAEGDPPPFANLGLDRSSVPSGQEEWGDGGLLVPGNWFSGDDADLECPRGSDDLCTCKGQGAAKRCFRKNTPGDLSVSAFQCRARLANPIKTLIGKIIGKEDLWIQAGAVATTSPHSIMALVDLSSTMYNDSHISRPGQQPDYPLPTNTHDCFPNAQYSNGFFSQQNFFWPMLTYTSGGHGGSNVPDACFFSPCGGREQWNNMPANRNDTPISSPIHFKDDFALVRYYNESSGPDSGAYYETNTNCTERCVAPGGCHNSSPGGKCPRAGAFTELTHTRIDVPLKGEAATRYSGVRMIDIRVPPQPLTTILNGFMTLLQELENAFGSTSKVGIIGFDRAVLPAASNVRTYKYGTEFNVLRSILNPNNIGSLIRNLFIPFTPSCVSAAVPGSAEAAGNGDGTVGLREAARELDNAENFTTKSILFFTDGLFDCQTEGNNNQRCNIGYVPPPGGIGAAINNVSHTLKAASIPLINNVARDLARRGVRVHVVLANDRERPHTLNILRQEYIDCCNLHGQNPNTIDGCQSCNAIPRWMDDKEAMANNVPFTWNEANVNHHSQPPSCPGDTPGSTDMPCYKGPSYYMYELAKRTGGRYLPLRPQPPDECCVNNEAICAGPRYNANGEKIGDYDRIPVNNPNSPEKSERQIYDPFCRSTNRQIADLVREIVADTDIRLVQ
jgi:citrate lyase gamma subunit